MRDYHKFVQHPVTYLKDSVVFEKLLSDINSRIQILSNTQSIGKTETEFLTELKELKTIAIDIYKKYYDPNINADFYIEDSKKTETEDTPIYLEKINNFVIGYVEVMHNFLKKFDASLNMNYHTNFAKPVLSQLASSEHTQIFFTFNEVDHKYLIDIRPLCLYLVWLVDLPNFTLVDGRLPTSRPVLPSSTLKRWIEGNFVDFREITFHDLGHSFVMNRNDRWLFETVGGDTVTLVGEFVENKNKILGEAHKLFDTDHALYNAIILYIFDIVHDRGYQFYLPMLLQQFRAKKNLDNIKTKILRNNFGNIPDEYTIEYIDSAQKWLINLVQQMLYEKNIQTISTNYHTPFTVKRFLDVKSYRGVPIEVYIVKGGKIMVDFLVDYRIKRTSLYEIELLGTEIREPFLDPTRISDINTVISILNTSEEEQVCIYKNGSFQIDKILSENPSHISVFEMPGFVSNLFEHLRLKSIEIFKLNRLFEHLGKKSINFSTTHLPKIHLMDYDICSNQEETKKTYDLKNVIIEPVNKTSDDYLKYQKYLEHKKNYDKMLLIEPQKLCKINYGSHEIQQFKSNRIIQTSKLHDSYIRYSHSRAPEALPFVPLEKGNDSYELGIVDTLKNPEIELAVSSLLTNSIEYAKNIYDNGYLPVEIVNRAQEKYVSPYAISNMWGKAGHRFVLSKKILDDKYRLIVGTILISSSKDNLFFFTSKYCNIGGNPALYGENNLHKFIDFEMDFDNMGNKWFDKFKMPHIMDYKPPLYNHIANFAIDRSCRNEGLGKFLIDSVIKNYAVNNIKNVKHSQYLLCGIGLFQIADPSWLKPMTKIGFKHRRGCESFFVDCEFDPLPLIEINGKIMSNSEYNDYWGLPSIYEEKYEESVLHVEKRIDEVLQLSKTHKLQYYQLYMPFDNPINV